MSTDQPLWEPSHERIAEANLTAFIKASGQTPENYAAFHNWSVQSKEEFWDQVWDFCQVKGNKGNKGSKGKGSLLENSLMPSANWFAQARLNFAENLLRYADDRVALVSVLENGEQDQITYKQLRQSVFSLSLALESMGVVAGDRVAAFMPNVGETVVAMLATAKLGAIWSSCSPDFGINGVLDRFGQISPKVLLATNGYYYNGKTIETWPRVEAIVEVVKSIEAVVVVDVIQRGVNSDSLSIPVKCYEDLISEPVEDATYQTFPFNHPLYIMYSSGTTGVPKCIVHGAGGTLLQHLKEHQLHVGLKKEDVLFYFTTCGWMMWNWLVSGLATGAKLVLYDGSPFYPDPEVLIRLIDKEKISVFGTSAKYISSLEKSGAKPSENHSLSSLKTILSTGSPLSHESFNYVYRDFKKDVCLSSISGGTDIISCFVLGNSILPVYEGEIQCRGLGMDVQIFNEKGESVQDQKGELVCCSPFPSMPLGFWNDPEDIKYKAAYFSQYPGVWAHGDYGEMRSHGGMIIHGRSDAVLNPGGVRIGTAEIYRQVERFSDVIDAVCIGQQWEDDIRVILFVVMKEGVSLTDELISDIKKTIRSETTPRHVPAKIISVTDIPRTISGKIVELAVRNIVHGLAVDNTDALANPQALEYFRDLAELN